MECFHFSRAVFSLKGRRLVFLQLDKRSYSIISLQNSYFLTMKELKDLRLIVVQPPISGRNCKIIINHLTDINRTGTVGRMYLSQQFVPYRYPYSIRKKMLC